MCKLKIIFQFRPFGAIWASHLRRQIDHAINKTGHAHQEDVVQLHQEIIKLVINILQKNSSKDVRNIFNIKL